MSKFQSLSHHVASPIQVERVVQLFEWGDNIGQSLIEAGATDELLAHLVVVLPADTLEAYRFAFVGNQINTHLGREMVGEAFESVFSFGAGARECLAAFQQAIDSGQKVASFRQLDFSDKWIIEYSRVIYPVLDRNGIRCAVGYYFFHENNLDGSCI